METSYGKKKFFSRNSAERTGHPYAKKKKKSHEFTQFKNINPRWITNLHVKCKTIKLLENSIWENSNGLGFGNDFSDTTSKNEIIDKLDLINIFKNCSAKDTVKKIKRHDTD